MSWLSRLDLNCSLGRAVTQLPGIGTTARCVPSKACSLR